MTSVQLDDVVRVEENEQKPLSRLSKCSPVYSWCVSARPLLRRGEETQASLAVLEKMNSTFNRVF